MHRRSDVIGVVKYLSDHNEESVKKVVCYLLDGEQAWADTWTEIGSSLDKNISVDVHFQPLDVTKPEIWSTQKKFLKANMFTLIYFVSEIYSMSNDKVKVFWKTLFDQAIASATFIYVDNGHSDFNNYFDTQWKARKNIHCIYERTNKRLFPHYAEQKSEFGA